MSQQSPSSAERPPFDAVKEIRFAVVIYGGVSLAIYINGIVQEMLRLVRATAPEKDLNSAGAYLRPAELQGSERIYRLLGQITGDPDSSPAEVLQRIAGAPPAPAPIRTRFVIDILSGTSAGGINAIFLSKALANNQSLEDLEQLWISQGDIEELINDRRSLKPPLTRQNPPQSLLNSSRMYFELLNALDSMDRKVPATEPSPLVDRLDLFTTATDIRGLTLPITLSDGVVFERRHKNVFHFEYPASNAPRQTDFATDSNPFLAFAARCTSAFPFAFEPMELDDVFPIVGVASSHMSEPYCDPATTYWERFYQDYLHTTPRTQPFQFRAFGDGGYLDNKPFSYAINTTLVRHSELPVERKLVYIEPNPEELGVQPAGTTVRPNAIENSLAALLVLPRYETIREDLERVVDRNLEIERVGRVVEDLRGLLSLPHWQARPQEWFKSKAGVHGAGYAMYERLKLSAVLDELADLVSSAYDIDPRGAFGKAVRTLTAEWQTLEYPDVPDQRRFLFDFDVQYRLRRIRYLRRRIQEEYAEPHVAAALGIEAYRAALRDAKVAFSEPYAALQNLLTRPALANGEIPEALLTIAELALIAAPAAQPESWPGLSDYRYVAESTDRGARNRARYVLQARERRAGITALAKLLAERFRPVLIQASDALVASFQDSAQLTPAAREARAFVRMEHDRFEEYDSVAFPITFGTDVDDNGPISIHRISPDDATARDELLQGRRKLRGQVLGSFGAFLDREWRRNDILWGRLDGAERLIGMMLPGSDAPSVTLRQRLVDAAHEEIVCEFLQLEAAQRPLWQRALQEFVAGVPEQPSPELIARSAARGTAVTGSLLEGISDGYAPQTKPIFSRIAFVGRALWGFVEISVPRSAGELFGTYWMHLLLLFSALLIVLAVVTGNSAAERLAIAVTTVVVIVYVLRELLRRYLRGAVLLSPANVSFLMVAGTLGLAALVDYLLSSYWPHFSTWAHALGGQSALMPHRLAGVLAPLRQGSAVFLACSLLVTVLAALWTSAGVHRARRIASGFDVVAKLKRAATYLDVIRALGLPVGPEDAHDEQARGKARSAVLHARNIAAAVTRALDRAHVFATAYAIGFAALALFAMAMESRIRTGRVLLEALFGLFGIIAAAWDMKGNQEVLLLLAVDLPDDPTQPLAQRPRTLTLLKQSALAAALAIAVYWGVLAVRELLRAG